MRLYRCQCGKAEYYASGMNPQPCQGCDECKTSYHGKPLEPHDWKPQFDCNTGLPARPICKRCYESGPKP